jgi:hypothetical protein
MPARYIAMVDMEWMEWSSIFHEEVFLSYLRGSNYFNSYTAESICTFAFLLWISSLSEAFEHVAS